MQLGIFSLNHTLLALFNFEITPQIKIGQKSRSTSHFKMPELGAESRNYILAYVEIFQCKYITTTRITKINTQIVGIQWRNNIS